MRMMRRDSGDVCLGEVIAASCELGTAVTCDEAAASELAARHVGRVLARRGNARLAAALALLAGELGSGTASAMGIRTVARRPAPPMAAASH